MSVKTVCGKCGCPFHLDKLAKCAECGNEIAWTNLFRGYPDAVYIWREKDVSVFGKLRWNEKQQMAMRAVRRTSMDTPCSECAKPKGCMGEEGPFDGLDIPCTSWCPIGAVRVKQERKWTKRDAVEEASRAITKRARHLTRMRSRAVVVECEEPA